MRAFVSLIALLAIGCGPTVAPPPNCPDAEKPEPGLVREGPVPPLLEGHYEIVTLQPKGHPAAPPETYLLPPDERKKCAFVRIVMSFDQELLGVRYEALCVEPEDRAKNPIPLKWCSTQGTMHVEWDIQAFELPVPGGTRSNVQQIASYAPGTGPATAVQERTLWGCKFNLDAQRFEILERTEDLVRLRAPKYEAEWVLKPTKAPTVDPDEVVNAVSGALHPPAGAPGAPPPPPEPPPKKVAPKKVAPGDDKF